MNYIKHIPKKEWFILSWTFESKYLRMDLVILKKIICLPDTWHFQIWAWIFLLALSNNDNDDDDDNNNNNNNNNSNNNNNNSNNDLNLFKLNIWDKFIDSDVFCLGFAFRNIR